MKLTGQRGIRSSKWVPNEILHADDINFISEAMYTNLTALLASITRPDAFGENEDIVMQGFTLNHNNLLTCDFSDGIACSFSGYYLLDGTWGFVASAGDIFSVVKPVAQSVAFTAGGTFARIDLLEVRPIRTAYDSKSRQFKDPITGLVTSSPIETKYEYGYEFAVREGDDTSALTKEQTTWTVNTATVGSDIAEKYVLFSTRSGDYYIWYNTGASGDPAVSGRTGIEVSINAGDDKDEIALATRTALNSHQLVTDGEIVISGATNQFIITVDYYVNVTDGTNGDMGSFFDAIAITQGNGAVYHTAGWIKIAEVSIGASASAITQDDILDVRDSGQWENESSGTRFIRWRAEEITLADVGDKFVAEEAEAAFQEVATDIMNIEEGVPYYDLIIDSVADLELLKVGTSDQYPTVFIKHGTYTTSEKLDFYAHGVKYLRGERLDTLIKFDTSDDATTFILLDNLGLYEHFSVEITVGGTPSTIIGGENQFNDIRLRDITVLGSGAGIGIHNGFTYISRFVDSAKGGLLNCSIEKCRYGFRDCSNLVGCMALDMTYDAFYSCEKLTNCVIDGVSASRDGFVDCKFLTNCYANDAHQGFYQCEFISSCKSSNNVQNGFELCERLSACYALSNGSDGFDSCTIMSACEAASSGAFDYDDCSYISSCKATGTGATYWRSITKVDNDSCNYS